MIRITSKKDGFRRCGIAHSKSPVEYDNKRFSKKEMTLLQDEPMLVVEVIADDDQDKNAAERKATAEAKAKDEAEKKAKAAGGGK